MRKMSYFLIWKKKITLLVKPAGVAVDLKTYLVYIYLVEDRASE